LSYGEHDIPSYVTRETDSVSVVGKFRGEYISSQPYGHILPGERVYGEAATNSGGIRTRQIRTIGRMEKIGVVDVIEKRVVYLEVVAVVFYGREYSGHPRGRCKVVRIGGSCTYFLLW